MQEKRADKFAQEIMIPNNVWEEIKKDYSENAILAISKKYKIPMSFIVGRLANFKFISYSSKLYNKYRLK